VDQIPAILAALATLLTAAGSLALLRRGKTAAANERAVKAEAASFRRLLMLRRFALWVTGRNTDDDPILARLAADVEKETT